MHVAAIASMKRGLEHFVYRELVAFTDLGIQISLFPTKVEFGLYNPHPAWKFHRWNPARVLLRQPVLFARQPAAYLRTLWTALRFCALVDFFLAWHFAEYMADADVIYATFGDRKFFVGYFGKLILGKPLVVEIQAYELYKNPNPRLFQHALAACDKVISTTEHNREILINRFGVPAAKVETVRLTVDTEEYHPERRFALLIVAYFNERKGHDILFEALRRLNRDDVEVWVVGDDGPEEPVDVRGLAKRLGVESRVVFFGKLSGGSLKALYRTCDAFCLPSRTERSGVAEGFPSAIIEAMAMGKPVISTHHVEIPRVLDEVLVPENDPEALAQAIERVLGDSSLRERLGEKNRRIAEELFSLRNPARTASIFGTLTENATIGTASSAPSGAQALDSNSNMKSAT